MTTLRQPYYELSPAVYNTLTQAKTTLENSMLDTTLMELAYLYTSQINGCAFCLEVHDKALHKSGVPQYKLDALAGWRIGHHSDEHERAALAQAELVTEITRTHAEDEVYQPLLEHFSVAKISDLTFTVRLMSCFNRLAVSMRMQLLDAGYLPGKKHKVPCPAEPFISDVINLKFPHLVWLNLFSTISSISISIKIQPGTYHRTVSPF